MSHTLTRAAVAAAAVSLGAHVAAAQWVEIEAPTNAFVHGLAVSPTSGQLVASVKATPASNFYHGGHGWSFDEGASWERSYAPLAPVLFDIEPHPTDPDVVWGAGFQAWKSGDGGRTWEMSYSLGSSYISAIAVDPLNPDRVYGVGQAFGANGTFHFTVDGGQHWKSTAPVPLDLHSDVLVVPSASERVVVLASGTGINRSTDNGKTFVNVLSPNNQYGQKLAGARQNPLVVWAILGAPSGKNKLWRSLDAAKTWAKVIVPVDDLNDVLPHPTDPARAWLATSTSGVLYTQNGGQSWSAAAGFSSMANLDSLAHSTVSSTTLFAGDQGGHGGIWRSLDGGVSWARTSTKLDTSVPILRLDGAGGVYGGGFSAPQRLDSPGASWSALEYPGAFKTTAISLAIHPSDPSTLAWVGARITPNKYNHVVVSSDGGVSWSEVTPQPAKATSFEVLQVAFDDDGTLYAGTLNGNLYHSQDLGSSWTQHPETPWYRVIDLLPDPHGPNRLFAIDERRFFRSEDLGQTWVRRAIGADEQFPIALTQVPTQPDTLFVLAGLNTKDLYRSVDAGDTWTRLSVGVDGANLTHVAVDPSNTARLLVATEQHGVHLSTDGAASFVPWNEGLASSNVVSVAFDPLVAGRAWLSVATGGLYLQEFDD
jgi:photosystem II stability/assembly factor-like uncharacterized protein